MIKNLKDLMNEAKNQKKMKLAVAAAQDSDVLAAVVEAAHDGIIEPILVGNVEEIKKIAKDENLDISSFTIIQADKIEESAEIAVKLVSNGEADFLMKGLIDTSILLKAVLNKEYGLRTESQLSHVMLYSSENYHKFLFLTDGGMNITPTLEEKVKITKNAIDVVKALGIKMVKVAALAAKEKVNPKMPVTVEARQLQDMCESGEFGEGVIIEGPLAFDLAVSEKAAEVKNFKSNIAGDVDVLLAPNIEVGNGIGKALTYIAKAESAGIIMGAKVPIVLVSRADSYESKLYSIALGSVVAANIFKGE
ncbi:MAG: bifunctional enoyl-CoA hydratase/phosphate acetyltransferase [Clostridiales bacterium]|nr:bifunctional enoyl-CoA hydratase/phosphate acetyltransferase [Clostridiales bacterium]